MTDKEGRQLIAMLSVNYPNFMPVSQEGVKVKTGMWMSVLAGVPFERAYKAILKVISENTYPPTIAHFKEALGINPELTRDEMQARLTGPIFGTEEGYAALYTADMDRVDKMMETLLHDIGGDYADERDSAERDPH